MEPYIPFSLDELNTSWKLMSLGAGIPKLKFYKTVLFSASGMGGRIPISPLNVRYQYLSHLQKCQIYCRFHGARPLTYGTEFAMIYFAALACSTKAVMMA